MGKSLFMGIDIGTTGIRAALFQEDGKEAGFDYKEYPAVFDRPGRLEIDPDLIFEYLILTVGNCVRKAGVTKRDIQAVGMSSQMHSLLVLDREGTPLTRVITWADTRAQKEAEWIREHFDHDDLYRKTGCRVQHPLYPVSKILWLKNNEPEIFCRAWRFATIKEYILLRLYGQDVIDWTDASACGYYNIHKQDWEDTILQEVLGIDRSYLGNIVECTFVMKAMKSEYADIMGIDRETPLVPGSGDGILANVGCGVFDDTAMSSTIGTSGALRIATGKPLLDTQQRTWCYSFTRDTWVAGGAINNGGIVLRWLRDEFGRQFQLEALELQVKSIYALFDRYASELRPGSDGLVFLPYLTGERAPDWNASARGTIHGLNLTHGRKHLIRAAMEGVMFRMYSVFEVITQISDNVRQIRANGGYAKSEPWMQIQADIFNKEITVAGIGEASVFGAAYVAMAAVGAIRDMKTLLPHMKGERVIQPVPGNHEIYGEVYQRAMEIYNNIGGC
jgi:gluconokinase